MFKKLLVVATLLAASNAQAAVSLTGTSYSQDFNSLTTSTSATAWANNSTLVGWSLFTKDNNAITTYLGGSGSVTTGSFYSFGASSDRALGGLGSAGGSANYFGSPQPASGAVAGYIAAAFTNNTGNTLNSITLGYNGEQWRNGGNSTAQTMAMQYGFGSTFSSVVWNTPGGNFNWTSAVNTTTAAPVDGNSAGLVAGKGGTINTTWNMGDTLWVRWIENNDVGNDHGLAIDNFTLNVVAIPEPETYAMFLAGLGLFGFASRNKQ